MNHDQINSTAFRLKAIARSSDHSAVKEYYSLTMFTLQGNPLRGLLVPSKV